MGRSVSSDTKVLVGIKLKFDSTEHELTCFETHRDDELPKKCFMHLRRLGETGGSNLHMYYSKGFYVLGIPPGATPELHVNWA